MSEYTIQKNKPISPFSLHPDKEECENMFGPTTKEFQRTPDSEGKVLAYDNHALQVTMDAAGKARELIFFQPNKLFIEDVQVLGRDKGAVLSDLENRGIKLEIIDVGFYSEEYTAVFVIVENMIDGVEVSCA